MAYEGAAEPADSDHVLRYKIARDIGTEASDAGLTDAQLRASPVPVTATVTSESTAEATAAAPTYTEGQDAPLSQTLRGDLRTTQTTLTQVSAAKTAGQSVVIPAGAKEWTVTIWTGTATVNGAAGCPAGFSDGSDKANAATITITFDTPGTGYVRYAT